MRATRGGFEVYVPLWIKKDSPQVRRFIEEGLRKLADQVPPVLPQQTSPDELRALAQTWAERIGVQPGKISLRPMQRKWGSCSGRQNITLNTALTWLPRPLAEYVILHELVHLRVFNHGKDFKALMSQHMPDWRARDRDLDQYHP
ncbi:MAG: M48 family metallopeptidase [Anaerolineae bacterium]|nr:M48 family metallopeptidase [Anaerolineae bacterium]